MWRDLIYDWNQPEALPQLELLDASLAVASGCPGLFLPTYGQFLTYLDHLRKLGVAGVELPPEIEEDRLRAVAEAGLKPVVSLFEQEEQGRLAELNRRHELGLEVFFLLEPESRLEAALGRLESGRALGLRTGLAIEQAGRMHPVALSRALRGALDSQVSTVALWDREGISTRDEVRHLVGFVAGLLSDWGSEVRLMWSGSNAGQVGVANALAACRAGASRARAGGLGVGDTVPLDLLLVNLTLNQPDRRTVVLRDYCRHLVEATGLEIASDYPVFGRDAFRTATGVHAAAIMKSPSRWLADRVYSGVPAELFGARQAIEVGPMSGRANVVHWLGCNGLTPSPERIEKLLQLAKTSDHVLTDVELLLALEVVS